jgi:hypothetical protein
LLISKYPINFAAQLREKVRISSTAAQEGQTTTFHEIECLGSLVK